MAFRSVPAQETILYNEDWTKKIDTLLINTPVQEKAEGQWDNKGSNVHALLTAQACINKQFGKKYTLLEIAGRKRKLLKRYRVFKRIIMDCDTKWNCSINHVDAEWCVWKKHFKASPLSKAYFHKGEGEFRNLDMLFSGRTDSPMAPGNEVINVSSGEDSSIDPQEAAPTVVVISDTEIGEEVESPFVVRPPIARKINFGPFKPLSSKLSFESTEHSTNTPEPKMGSASHKFPLRNAFPPKPTKAFNLKDHSANSQASSSPAKFGSPSFCHD